MPPARSKSVRKSTTKRVKPAARKVARVTPRLAPVRAAKAKPAAPARRSCLAKDPFGDPCQSSPRLPSRYCTIHSYLDR